MISSESSVSQVSNHLILAGFDTFDPNTEKWCLYKERLENYFLYHSVEETRKVQCLLNSIGSTIYKVLHDMCCPALPSTRKFDELCLMLSSYFSPAVNKYKERKSFYAAEKSSDESSVEWMARLRSMASNCDFGDIIEKVVLDKFVTGLSGKCFERLSEEEPNKFSIEKALSLAAKYESNDVGQVDFVNKNYKSNKYRKSNSDNKNHTKCQHFGYKNHSSDSCKFKNAECYNCKEKGHFASVCRKKKSTVNLVVEKCAGPDEVIDFGNVSSNVVFNISSNPTPDDAINAVVEMYNKQYTIMIDSGSSSSLIK